MNHEQKKHQGGQRKKHRRRRGRGGGGGQRPEGQQQAKGPQKGGNQPPRGKRPEPQYKPFVPPPPKRYGIVFYETIAAAKGDIEALRQKATEVDQLNIVIKAESDMEDAELKAVGKVFAGAAWTLIHERRVEEGWYNEPH